MLLIFYQLLGQLATEFGENVAQSAHTVALEAPLEDQDTVLLRKAIEEACEHRFQILFLLNQVAHVFINW